MVVPAFHYALGDMSPYYLFAGWIYDLPYSCAAKRWTFAGFFRIAIDVLQVRGRHCHHNHHHHQHHHYRLHLHLTFSNPSTTPARIRRLLQQVQDVRRREARE